MEPQSGHPYPVHDVMSRLAGYCHPGKLTGAFGVTSRPAFSLEPLLEVGQKPVLSSPLQRQNDIMKPKDPS